MKHSSWIRIIAMLMVLCMLFTACKPKKDDNDEAETETPGDDIPEENPNPVPPVCEHTNTKIKNAKPTGCTAPGYTGDKVCTKCGVTVEKGTEIPMVDHHFDDGMVTKNPTCMDEGTYTYTCTGCGLTKSNSLPTVGHDDRYHDALDGTHNHTCATCTMSENSVHTPDGDGVYHKASCLESAYNEFTCSLCGGVYKEYIESEPALGHEWGDWTLEEATCVADGNKVHSCNRCESKESITLLKTPDIHNLVFVKYDPAPTCDKEGVAHYACADCGAADETKSVPATGLHNYELIQDNGDGWIISKCSGCGKEVSRFDASHLTEAEVKTESIPDDKPFEVTTQNATIEFPTDVIGQIKGDGSANLDVSISAGVLDDAAKEEAIEKAKENLSDEAKARLDNVDIYDFSVTVSGSALSDNFASAVTVTIPYELKVLVDEDGNEYLEDKDGIIIWYVGVNGEITEITDVLYNEETKTVTFLAPHFSMYAVAYKETQEMMCRRGHHAYTAIETVKASCVTHGYTLYECDCCHRKTVDDIQEKKKHNYGEIIAPVPTCDKGDYYHQICADCGDVLNIQYVRALGHVLDQVASCDKGSSCSRCNKIVTPALGHNWSEWKVVVEPGELSAGLKVRYCSRCGKSETASTASIGDVTALDFESYEQMAKAIYDLFVGLDNGIIEFSFTYAEMTVKVTATVNETEEDLLIGVDYVILEGSYEIKGSAIYKNGTIIMDTLETDPSVGALNLDSLMFAPINVAFTFMQAYHDLINPYAEMYLGMAREEFNKYIELVGEDINKALEAAGSEYTAEDLVRIMDSVETVYAYVSLKLGCSTSAQIKDGVLLPTKNDVMVIVKALMEETVNGENKTYSVNAEPLVKAIETVLGWVEENQTKSIDTLIFELLGEELQKLDPAITDVATFVAYLKTNIPGTLKVKDVVDKMVTVLEESGVITLTELYEIINAIAIEATHNEQFNIEAMITEYYDVTLNSLVAMKFGEEATVEQLYDMLAARASEITLGSLPVGEATVSQYVSMLSAQLESLVVKAEFSFTVDENGKLVSLTLDELLNMLVPGETDGSFVEYPIQNVHLNIIRDESAKVVIPDKFKPVDTEVKSYFDEDGNFIISGIPADFKLDAFLEGYYNVALKDILLRDPNMSMKLGYDVLVTHKDFWDRNQTVEEFIVIDGKLYKYETAPIYINAGYKEEITATVDLFEFMNDPTMVIPDSDDQPIGSYKGTDVYNTPIGFMAQFDGEWWICDASVGYNIETGTGDINYLSGNYRFFDRFNSEKEISISSISDILYVLNGANIYNASVTLYIGSETYSFHALSKNEEVLLAHSFDNNNHDNYRYVIGKEANLSDYDYDEIHYEGASNMYVVINGETKYMSVERAFLIKKLPSYYAKVADGIYVNIEHGWLGNYNPSGLNTMELTDGNTLYVSGIASAVEYGYVYGEMYYGYVKLANNLYIRTFCVVQDGHMVEICYEGATDSKYVSYHSIYDINEYMTVKKDGTIVISKDLVSLLKKTCTDMGDYAGVEIYATKTVSKEVYCIKTRACLEFCTDNIDFSGMFGGASHDYDIFNHLFGGMGGSTDNPNRIYVDENGNLVIESSNIYYINTNFSDRFPADSILNPNYQLSQEYGYNIYTYETVMEHGDTKVLIDGKYYYYDWSFNYTINTATIESLVHNNWKIRDMRYRYDLVPNEIFSESIPVYDVTVTFVDSYNGPADKYNSSATFYMVVKDGELCVLTGAYETGESLLTFEGYMPADDYFESLAITTEKYNDAYYYIGGNYTELTQTRVILKERDYNITKAFYIFKAPDGGYIYSSVSDKSVIHIRDEFKVPGNYTLESVYSETWYQGVYQMASFSYEEREIYKAIRIGDKFYDYDSFNGWHGYNWKIDEETFKEIMYKTERVYSVVDNELGYTRYYKKFIPGEFFVMYEEIFNVWFPGTVSVHQTHLGYDKSGNDVYELWYYVDESLDSSVETETLSDGSVFYHIDGIGYVKIANTSTYIKAFRIEKSDGSTEVVCTLTDAYIRDYHLSEFGYFKDYISYTDNKVVIPAEMLDFMYRIPVWCYFEIGTNGPTLHFDYYTLKAYFENGGGFGGDIGGGDLGGGDIIIRPVDPDKDPSEGGDNGGSNNGSGDNDVGFEDGKFEK